jgi:hypothetical protein
VLGLTLMNVERLNDPVYTSLMAETREQEIKLRLGMLCVAVQQLRTMEPLGCRTDQMILLANEKFDSAKGRKTFKGLDYGDQLKQIELQQKIQMSGVDLACKIMSLKTTQNDLVAQITQLAVEYWSYRQGGGSAKSPTPDEKDTSKPSGFQLNLNPQEREQARQLTGGMLSGRITLEDLMEAIRQATERGGEEVEDESDESAVEDLGGCGQGDQQSEEPTG